MYHIFYNIIILAKMSSSEQINVIFNFFHVCYCVRNVLCRIVGVDISLRVRSIGYANLCHYCLLYCCMSSFGLVSLMYTRNNCLAIRSATICLQKSKDTTPRSTRHMILRAKENGAIYLLTFVQFDECIPASSIHTCTFILHYIFFST